MKQEDIIFFEQLGFGWVVDKRVIRSLLASPTARQRLSAQLLLNRAYREKHQTG